MATAIRFQACVTITDKIQASSLTAARRTPNQSMVSSNQREPECILCQHSLRHIGEDFKGKQIYKCVNCRYVCTTIATTAEAKELYDNPEYFDGWGGNLEFDYDRFEPSAHRQVEDYLDFIAAHTLGKSLLDVGTGSGLLPHLALQRGYEVEGTDLSKHVSETVPAKGGFPVHHGNLDEIQFDRNYDIITLFHVLEHSENPLAMIGRCRDLLTSEGFIIVVVPNYESLDSRIKDMLSKFNLKKRPYKHLALGHHNWVFSLRSLELIGEKCGLQVIHRETRQPAWRANAGQQLLGRCGLATWCWIVYRKVV
jgi:2-polyprenyl-3-methyl-5-hydroxy-6-metoxy-1,4-benzoquinol methylase